MTIAGPAASTVGMCGVSAVTSPSASAAPRISRRGGFPHGELPESCMGTPSSCTGIGCCVKGRRIHRPSPRFRLRGARADASHHAIIAADSASRRRWKACRRLGTSLHEHRSAALSCRWPWFHPLCVRPWPADAGRFSLRLMLSRRFAWICAALLLVAGLPASAQDADTVTLNFVNADIDAVVKAVGEITGRNFLVDPRVKGTVNIVSARPVAKALVYPTLLSALRMQGFAAVETDGVVKIVPEADAKTQAGPVQRGAVTASGERIVTQVIALRYESAAQLVTVLRPLITPNNTIAAYVPGNAIIITDYADNLRRIDRIVASLDQAPAGEPMLVPVKNASALDVVALVNRMLTDTGGTSGTPGAQAGCATAGRARRRSAIEQHPDSRRQSGAQRARAAIDRAARHAFTRGRQRVHRVSQERGCSACRGDAARPVRRRPSRRAECAGGPAATLPIAAAMPANAASGFPAIGAGDQSSGDECGRSDDGVFGRRRDDPGRHDEQRADHHGAGARLQQPARGDRATRLASRAGVRRGADRRGVVGQGGRIRHPVAGADRRRSQSQRRAGVRRHQFRRA